MTWHLIYTSAQMVCAFIASKHSATFLFHMLVNTLPVHIIGENSMKYLFTEPGESTTVRKANPGFINAILLHFLTLDIKSRKAQPRL